MGGAPFDKAGDDTYQIPWRRDTKLYCVTFVRDEGDATLIGMELYDKDAEAKDAKLLFKDTLSPYSRKEYKEGIELRGVKLGRLWIRLVALDGEEQNHCKAVFKGMSLTE